MRLIDVDELLEHLYVGVEYDKAIDDGIKKTDDAVFAFRCGWNDALKSVAEYAPTVDAKPVIRCKDCAWFWDGWCSNLGIGSVLSESYCSWGARKYETD